MRQRVSRSAGSELIRASAPPDGGPRKTVTVSLTAEQFTKMKEAVGKVDTKAGLKPENFKHAPQLARKSSQIIHFSSRPNFCNPQANSFVIITGLAPFYHRIRI